MKKVKIVEVGPRDGLQNESKILSTDEKLEFINLLSKAGLKTIEITSFVRADKIPQMADAIELYSKLDKSILNRINTPCLVPNLKGLELAKSVGVKEIALFTASSDEFNKKNINATVDESFLRLNEVANACDGILMRGYISTVFGCPYSGKISFDKTFDVIEKFLKLGVYEISLGDTIGVAQPQEVSHFCERLKENFDLEKFAMHFHDTEGMALANIYESYRHGVTVFDSSAAGLGGCPYARGASGNVATDDVANMFQKMNIETGIDQMALHAASKYILEKLGKTSQSKFYQALNGRN